MVRRLFWYSIVAFLIGPVGLFADTLRGVVQDERGQAVVGARIDVATAAPKIGRGIFCPSCYLDCRKWTRTNDQGEFVIEGLDPKLKFRILSTAVGKQTKMTDLIDPANETASLVLPDFPEATPASQIIEGRIVSTEGTPIPGALVEPYGAKTSQNRWWGRVDVQPTVSDDKGRFRMLLDAPDYEGVDVVVAADGYAGARGALLKPGQDVHELKIPVGTSITGLLVYQGQPQAAQRISVVQTERGMENHFIKSVLAITDSEGRFEFHNLPASQQYAIFSPVGEVDPRVNQPPAAILITKTFRCLADNETRDLGALELSRSCSVEGKLEMSDGTRLPDGLKMNLNRDPAWDLIEVSVSPEGYFRMDGLPPETYEFMINSKGFRIDGSRLNYQLVRANSFGVRLTQTREGLLIPLLRDEAARQKADSTRNSDALDAPNTAANDEVPEIAASKPGAPGGTQIAVELSDEPVPADGPKLSVRGTVITAKGERIAGATVILRANIGGEFYMNGLLHNHDVLARTTSNTNGQFVLSNVPIPLRLSDTITKLISDQGGAQLVCYAEGYALAVTDVPSINNKQPLRVVLGPEADVRGVIRDQSGKGVAGARIELQGITTSSGEISHMLNGPSDVKLFMSQMDRISKADDDGNFVIKHAPANRRLIVAVTAERYVRQVMAIETTVPLNGIPKRSDELMFQDRISVQQSPVEIKLETGPTVTVRVIDHDGSPVVDGVVEYMRTEGNHVKSRSISAGTGSITFNRQSAGQWRLQYTADPLHPRIGMSLTMNAPDPDREQPIELPLPESRWLTGRVTNAATGEPVVGAMIHVAWAGSKQDDVSVSANTVSRENGEFRIPAKFGENRIFLEHELCGFVGPRANAEGRVPAAVVRVTQDGDLPEVSLKMTPGLILEGTVVDELGKPVVDAIVRAEQTQGRYRQVAVRTNIDGKYQIAGLSPANPTMLTVVSGPTADRKTVEGGAVREEQQVRRETVDLTVTAGVQLTGRVLKNGRPLSGVKMELSRSLPGRKNTSNLFATVTTDDAGRYIVGGLEPGDGYGFNITTRDNATAPGWTHQSPYVQTIPENAKGVIELPDANLISSNQSLKGTVVDPDGKPVVGFTVSAQMKSGQHLARRGNLPPPWTETDQAGQFQLSQLPDGEIELMAYRANPAGGFIRYPVRMTPDYGQADIRIVVDPKLLDGVEDIDKDSQPVPIHRKKPSRK